MTQPAAAPCAPPSAICALHRNKMHILTTVQPSPPLPPPTPPPHCSPSSISLSPPPLSPSFAVAMNQAARIMQRHDVAASRSSPNPVLFKLHDALSKALACAALGGPYEGPHTGHLAGPPGHLDDLDLAPASGLGVAVAIHPSICLAACACALYVTSSMCALALQQQAVAGPVCTCTCALWVWAAARVAQAACSDATQRSRLTTTTNVTYRYKQHNTTPPHWPLAAAPWGLGGWCVARSLEQRHTDAERSPPLQ